MNVQRDSFVAFLIQIVVNPERNAWIATLAIVRTIVEGDFERFVNLNSARHG